ncbi:hypothetical protein F4775DRAFT_607507 [Biscogniauxia sp. FL1348]|nr:hypothetical protein F4775DRAFT_607507 [Biscogniauxia sp. FL1348]
MEWVHPVDNYLEIASPRETTALRYRINPSLTGPFRPLLAIILARLMEANKSLEALALYGNNIGPILYLTHIRPPFTYFSHWPQGVPRYNGPAISEWRTLLVTQPPITRIALDLFTKGSLRLLQALDPFLAEYGEARIVRTSPDDNHAAMEASRLRPPATDLAVTLDFIDGLRMGRILQALQLSFDLTAWWRRLQRRVAVANYTSGRCGGAHVAFDKFITDVSTQETFPVCKRDVRGLEYWREIMEEFMTTAFGG